MEQRNLFGAIEPPTIAIEESARRLGVSTATIRNWIKTKYLEQAEKGRITLESLEQFQSEVSGKEKLTQRANKSLKDSHNHDKTVSRFFDEINSSISSSDTIGIEYEASLSDSYRNKEGIYYTPDEVVRDLFAAPEDDIQASSFCDPCCGSGNFVVRAIELGFKPENIYGYDIDPVAVEVAKARICKVTGYKIDSFSCNPKSILNLYGDDEDALTLQHLMSIPYITLKNKASWGLGIVTGNNKRFIRSTPESGYIPVYKGADILV